MRYTGDDPISMLAALLCTGREASLLLEQQRYATTVLCLCLERPHKRPQLDDPRNSPYNLGYYGSSVNARPHLAPILAVFHLNFNYLYLY